MNGGDPNHFLTGIILQVGDSCQNPGLKISKPLKFPSTPRTSRETSAQVVEKNQLISDQNQPLGSFAGEIYGG